MSQISSILKQLLESAPPTETSSELESQGRHAFAAVRNLIDKIEKVCTEEEAEDLIKRFFNASKSDDFRKFRRGIQKMASKANDDDKSKHPEEGSSDE